MLAANEAEHGRIVTLGINPTHPSAAYGYIKPASGSAQIPAVENFLEKPSEEMALEHISNGYVWNSGNFIAQAKTLAEEFKQHAPQINGPVRAALNESRKTSAGIKLGPSFHDAQKKSFDYAIMEATRHASVLKTSLPWQDLGAWDAVYDVSPKDESNNSTTGDVLALDTKDCQVRSAKGKLTVLSNVTGLNVVVEDDVVLISDLRQSQSIKQVVDQLVETNRPEFDIRTNEKPLQHHAGELRKWLDTHALPLWTSFGFDHKHGFWREELDADAKPTGKPIRARVQGRQNFSLASAVNRGWQGVATPISALTLTKGRNAYLTGNGWYRTLIDQHGDGADDREILYDQAFNLLAMSALSQSVVHEQVISANPLDGAGMEEVATNSAIASPLAAEAYYDRLVQNFGAQSPSGQTVFREHETEVKHLSNPNMHLLEALLFWAEATEGDTSNNWLARASSLVEFAKAHLIDQTRFLVSEFFDEDWKPIHQQTRSDYVPGHYFEWAWLLVKWYELTGDADGLDLAEQLFETGTFAINPVTGAVVDHMTADRTRTTETSRLWPQCEWLKASLALARNRSGDAKSEYESHALKAVQTLRRYFDTPTLGLWFDKLNEDNSFQSGPSPASSLYHISIAVDELERYCS